jgi:cytidylate kinase
MARDASDKRFVIAIDGPAASGKSSTAALVAQALGVRHLDSGALYRAVTAARLRGGGVQGEHWSDASLVEAAQRCALVASGWSFVATIDGERVEAEVRGSEVTRRVSDVAKSAPVREFVNGALRAIATEFDAVVDGRDIGAAVFPDALLKIYLVADPWERARRRMLQGGSLTPSYDEIAAETERLLRRDARDASPSRPAADAVLIDTTHLAQSEQVARIVALANALTHHGHSTFAIDLD